MKLIKIDGYWIIVSDEERVKGDIVLGNFPDNPIGIITDIYGEEFTVTCFNGDKVGLAQYDSFKILYSQNPEHNLPSITFSDEVAKELGIDLFSGEIALTALSTSTKIIKFLNENGGEDIRLGELIIDLDNMFLGLISKYKEIYDNKDKLFTLEQAKQIWDDATKKSYAWLDTDKEEKLPDFNQTIQSLTKQEYEVELEIEYQNQDNKWSLYYPFASSAKTERPRITNNSVKVIKIIK